MPRLSSSSLRLASSPPAPSAKFPPRPPVLRSGQAVERRDELELGPLRRSPLLLGIASDAARKGRVACLVVKVLALFSPCSL